MMSQTIGQLALALSKLQGSVGLIPKTRTATITMKSGGQYKYAYADLADIWDAIRDALKNNELAITQVFNSEGSKYFITTYLLHSSGEWISSVLELDTHEKIQELGSEITYLRRYGLSSILGIAADEDEDGKLANDSGKSKKEEPKNSIKVVEKKEEPKLTREQKQTIAEAAAGDFKYLNDIAKSYGCTSMDQVPASKYSYIINMIKAKKEQAFNESTGT